jgi:N-acyl homoserine lactone hydrolase
LKIHALSTGSVRIKTAMARARGGGPMRFVRTFADRHYGEPLPIHAWLIEHPDGPVLVDTGELATSRDMPIARFDVERDEEIDRQLASAGFAVGDLSQVVLTHLHGDHINGLARLPGARVVASAHALRGGSLALRRRGQRAEPLQLTDGPFGAFHRSARLTADGRLRAVAVPGHARGQIAVVVVQDDHHVFLAADSAYDQQQLLDLHPDGVSMSARLARRSMLLILEHAERHPTVFLPSHDRESANRLAQRSLLRPQGPAHARPQAAAAEAAEV